jgi:hypothetical protein
MQITFTAAPCGDGLEYFHCNTCESEEVTEREPSSLKWDSNYRPVLSSERVEYFHRNPCES